MTTYEPYKENVCLLEAGDHPPDETTAAVTGVLPVPAGTRALKLSPTLTKALISQFATGAGTTNVTFEGYISNQNPVDLSKFYDQKMVELGYTSHPPSSSPS